MKALAKVLTLALLCWGAAGIDCFFLAQPEDPPECVISDLERGSSTDFRLDFGQVIVGEYTDSSYTSINNGDQQYGGQVSWDGAECYDFWFSASSRPTGDYRFDFIVLEEDSRAIRPLRFGPSGVGPRSCILSAPVCGSIELYGEGREPPKPVGWYECTATPIPGANFRSVWAASETDIHVVGENGAAFHSDGNCEWQAMGPGFTGLTLTDVWGSASGDVWIVGNSDTDAGNIFHFDGSGWSLADQYGLVTYDAVWGSDACNVYFGGLGVSTDFPNAKYYDCAQFDSLVVDMGWDPITGIWGTAKDDIWVVMQQPNYSIWHGDKSAWTNETPTFADAVLHDVWVAPTGEVFAVGEGGTIYHHDGSGWVDQTITGLAEHFYGVGGTSATNVMAVGQGGMIYQYDGTAWAPMEVPGSVTDDLRGVYGLSNEVAFAVGDGGTILFYGEQQ